MYDRVLVPLDGSERAEEALPHAREIARSFGARLYLVRVVEPLFVPPLPSFAGPQFSARDHPGDTEAAQAYLEEQVRCLSDEGVSAEAVVRHGDPSDEILECIAELAIDLVIIAPEVHGGVGRLTGGHTSPAVLARAGVPVLVVPLRPAGASGKRSDGA